MKTFFFKDISYLSIARIFGFANIPLQTFIFANYLSAELIQDFFILFGLFSLVVMFEGGAGTVLTYEYNRRLNNKKKLVKLIGFFKKRFFKLTIYYFLTSITAFFIYDYIFSGMLNEYKYQYFICIFLTIFNFNLYPIICISEGSGRVRGALLVKSVAPILSMLIFLVYVFFTGKIYLFFIIPTTTLVIYILYIFFYEKHVFKEYFFNESLSNKHTISKNVSKANVSWTSGYILTQGFPLLLPFVLSVNEAARLILTANLLNAFLTFLCIGATIIGPRIPDMIRKNQFDYKKLVLKNLIFIYLILVLCLIFFDELLSVFYLAFNQERFLESEYLFLFCLSFGFIPLYHFSVILLKGIGIEPFARANMYVAIATACLVFICSYIPGTNFLSIYIWFRLTFVTSIYVYKMIRYRFISSKLIHS